ncbi:MAG: RNA polymerase sigma factor [Vulcanimicrobiota bacterium]
MSENDRILVARAQKGDREAFEVLVEQHARPIYTLVFRMVRGRREEAEDLTQEVMLRAFKALPRFRGEAKFSTWLHRIAVNLTLNRLQKKSLNPQSLSQGDEGDGEHWLEIPDTSMAPEVMAERAETMACVRAALAEMSESLRVVFLMRELQGMSHDDIAATLGASSEAVRVRHHRAKKELVKRLASLKRAREGKPA